MKTYSKKIKQNQTFEPQAQTSDPTIADFCTRLKLKVIRQGKSESLHISTTNINRPGLALVGFLEHFSAGRVQVIGENEMAYLSTLPQTQREKAIEGFMKQRFPCVIFSSGLVPDKSFMQCAERFDCVIFSSSLRSTTIINELSIYLNEMLAPEVVQHGVLMDVFGVGVLIEGKSGVGKSETVLGLLERMHRLVADDAVSIKRIGDRLIGSSPEAIRYFMEVRGIGIIDVRSMYGAGAVLHDKQIDLVLHLEEWNSKKEYNRLGSDKEVCNILGLELPLHTIPVRSGRNMSIILEVAARNYRLKSLGYDALSELNARVFDE